MVDLESKRRRKGIGKVSGRKRVTMHDIGRVAGCSQPTVSAVLSHNKAIKISVSTKKRVFDAAEELGYHMFATSEQSRDKCSTTHLKSNQFDGPIGFVIDSLATSPEGVNAFDGVLQAVRGTGNVVLLAETKNDPVLEPKTLALLLDQGVTAIIYACVFLRQVTLPSILKTTDTPVFLLNCYSNDLAFPAVIPSEVAGGHSATNALIKAGHTRIATIVGEGFMECASSRLIGYRNALATADLPFHEELVIEGNWLPSSGYSATQTLMSMPNPPTAIFCQNDRMAVGAYEALKELGFSIPSDISVVGFDDDEIARHMSPPLTSMNLPSRAMGRWVVEQLFHDHPTELQRHLLTKLECELVERDSIGPPKQGKV